jgi:ligand-binding sensor domain-containing protein
MDWCKNGLSLFNPTNKRFRNYYHQDGNQHSLSNNWVTSVLKDSHNRMWIGTRGED